MWTFQYILSQLCVFIAVVLFAITLFIKNKTVILVLSGSSCMLYAIQYLLLGAYTGMALDLLAVFRAIWFYINEKRSKAQEPVSLIVICVLFITLSIITISSWFDIVIMFASVVYTYALWQKNIKVYRYLSVVSSISWLSYNIYYKTIVAIISESIMLCVEVIGIINYYVTSKKEMKSKNEDNKVVE